MRKSLYLLAFVFAPVFLWAQDVVDEKSQSKALPADSISMAPTQVKQYGNQNYEDLTLPKSGIDLQDPDNIKTEVEYQPQTGYYIIHTKVGDTDIATPYLMTEGEYRDYSARQAMQLYWAQKIQEVEHNNERKFDITDMKFNIGAADKVFGPGGVQLKLQGSAELKFAFDHQYINNPSLTARSRNNNIFDFDEKIQLSANGKVGDKLNFNMNYNTESSFDFDRQNLKLTYKGKEDDIIQSIEAGNVSMNLNSSLITGSQALFGIKTDLKFGKLTIQALISQQNSQSQSVSSDGGAQTTKFEVNADQYDENRHFFLAHYFRDHYEESMAQMPFVASGVNITRIEVWVTNKRGRYDEARNIVAFADLGEFQKSHISNTYWKPQGTAEQPRNDANTLYGEVRQMSGIRDIQQTNAVLDPLMSEGIIGGVDYEKIESARLLTSSEYTLNSTLGFISLRQALNQDEVLCVAYEYTYGGQVYQVGEFSSDKIGQSSASAANTSTLILKMLKSSNNAPFPADATRFDALTQEYDKYGTWPLMMKNVYSIGATQMSSEKFEMNIFYRNDSVGTDLQYLPEGAIKGKQLLRVMLLDRLDSKQNRTPDGRFDYVEGYTAISSGGKIIFPVLEPFGSHLKKQINNSAIADKYVFQELYDSTLVVAQEMSEKNKFTLSGKYKGSSGSEIRLNAMNIPRGSVTVTAGGATLTENVDYTVDYTMGTVTILNQSILDAGTKVDVKLENQSMFSMQRKALYGLHLDYAFNKDFVVGATLMHMRERPLTTKVSTGQEPLANTIWGLNLAYKKEFMWLSNAINAIPWIKAEQPSSIQVGAEFAQLIPGHTRDVGKAGTAYIDDFESTKTNIDVHYPSYWHLSSTPARFAEANMSNKIDYGKNRAHLVWFNVDQIFGHPQANTPQHIRSDLSALSDHRTRIVYEQEIYPNREVLANEDTRLSVLNLSYYPQERGAYNIAASEIGADGNLTNPQNRWGGMMRKLDNTDFENSNIEYIEFWLMDPLLTNPDPTWSGGKIYFDLGDISEDILKDGKKSFEHGLPVNEAEEANMEYTIWGRVPKTTSTVAAFSNEAGARQRQDVGLNGLSTEQEFEYEYTLNGVSTRPYAEYVQELRNKVSGDVLSRWQDDPFSPLNDPAGDNYHYYRGSDYDRDEVPVLDRYKHYNGTEGNSPDTENSRESYGTASSLTPDIEDINGDNTLSEYEKYFEYEVDLRPGKMEVGQQYITEKMVVPVTLKNGETQQVTWYQFKIPVRDPNAYTKVGAIRNFKSIRFMRVYMTDFSQETFLRFATLDLVRGEWRQYTKDLHPHGSNVATSTTGSMDVQALNIEENSSRTPVNYVLPPGVSRQTTPGQVQLIAQNEQAMVMRVHDLEPTDARAVYKKTSYDMRQYKRLQMFVHAEQLTEDPELRNGDLSVFIRLGSDMRNNYYEYEIPLDLTEPGLYNNSNEQDRWKVWLRENMFDFEFSSLTKAKLARNKAKRQGNNSVSNTIPYVIYDDDSGKPKNRITVMGNPTLGEVDNIMIGVRNKGNVNHSGEVWVNELRMTQFNEDGGVAAMANVSLAVSDIAQVNVAGRVETAGYGSIESNVLDRNLDNQYQFSVSAALEAGRLFPEQAKLQIPLYVAYSNNTNAPKYDPLDTDIELQDNLATFETKHERDSVKQMSNTVNTSTNFSVSNAKVNIHSKKKDMFYDPANFSISYSRMEQNQHTPDLERDFNKEDKGSFTYQYNFNPKPWEPFKNSQKVKDLKWIKELNIYYLPQSWGFSTDMRRSFSHLKMRDFNQEPTGSVQDITFSKDWMWNRNFDFKYDLTKNLKFTFQTAMNSTIDEGYYTPEIIRDYAQFTHDEYLAWKDTVLRSLKTMGTPYTYQQVFTGTYSVPFNRFKSLDWLTANGSYNATYNWNRTVNPTDENSVDMGNVISSVQTWQVDGSTNFENLYSKSKYWKELKQRYSGRNGQRRFRPKNYTQTISLKADSTVEISHNLGNELLVVKVNDSAGKPISVKHKTAGKDKITLTSKKDISNATITITTRDPNERTPQEKVRDLTAYFFTMIRKVQVTYRETNSLVVPGFYPQAGFMGQRRMDGRYAPGFDYAFGFIPDDFLDKAKRNGWLSPDTTVVQPATRAHTTDFDVKITLEPFPGFKIQVNGKRYMANSSSIIYTYDNPQETFTGSFNITTVALATAFDRIGSADDNFSSKSFDRFLHFRDVMQGRVQSLYDGAVYPNQGFIQNTATAGQTYDKSKGRVDRNSADVLVPAFLAAYTGRSSKSATTNPILGILQILPNWSITYDGLGRLPWMKDHFRSVTLTHAYVAKYSIGSYSSFSTWVPAQGAKGKQVGFVRDVETDLPLPSSAYDISSASITEQFSPLIGLNLAMKNSMTAKFEYRKQRNLTLNVNSVQLMEGATDEFVIGWGYTIKDFDIIIKLKSDKENKIKNDLKLAVDVSYKDMKTLLRKVEENLTQASSGNKVWGLKISADYVLSSKVNLQLFYEHQSTIPLISSSYPVKQDNAGVSIKLMLTRQ
ncbi:MAG: cell surface protein SprA [Paludibacteraceae bacterium]|nr:cell surface protein SprA [Paludibacteraceae bacterium]